MEKRLFVTDANDLISLIENSDFKNVFDNLPIGVEDVTNYWVNDILNLTGRLPVNRVRRYLDKVETHCTLTAPEMGLFKSILFHTIEKFETGELGYPTMHHRISGGMLEFYILRG